MQTATLTHAQAAGYAAGRAWAEDATFSTLESILAHADALGVQSRSGDAYRLGYIAAVLAVARGVDEPCCRLEED